MFCANEIHILSSKKKIEFLKPLEQALSKRNDLPDLQLHMRNKVCGWVGVGAWVWMCAGGWVDGRLCGVEAGGDAEEEEGCGGERKLWLTWWTILCCKHYSQVDKDAENFREIAEAMKKSKSVRTDHFSSDLTYACVCDFIPLSPRASWWEYFRRIRLLASSWRPGRTQWLRWRWTRWAR